MEKLLNKPDTIFFHLTTNSRLEGIRDKGLMAFNPKGISVVRTSDIRVLNSLIVTQLQNDEVLQENHFVLLSLSQSRNNFSPQQIKPDLVTEWTWPLHNNIVDCVIPFNCMEIVCEFSVPNWDAINIQDFKNQQIISNTDIYDNSFLLIYSENGKRFQVNREGKIKYL